MEERKVAFVTGASRGIGKAIAVHLARAGFDVALTARTIHDGEGREHSSTQKRSDTTPLPGSLDSTAALVEGEGRRALAVKSDLLDRTSLGAAIDSILEGWGHIDVLVNNARYVGPGHMDHIVETPIELLDRQLEANAMAPLVLIKHVLPSMLERGEGIIVNVSSAAATSDPPAPAGQKGGYGLGYAFSKAAFHRIAGFLALELGNQGIRAYNLEPGYVATERFVIDMGQFGFDTSVGLPVNIPAAVAAWLVTDPRAAEPNGRTVNVREAGKILGILA